VAFQITTPGGTFARHATASKM